MTALTREDFEKTQAEDFPKSCERELQRDGEARGVYPRFLQVKHTRRGIQVKVFDNMFIAEDAQTAKLARDMLRTKYGWEHISWGTLPWWSMSTGHIRCYMYLEMPYAKS